MTVPVLRCSVSRCIVPGTGDPSDSIVRQLAACFRHAAHSAHVLIRKLLHTFRGMRDHPHYFAGAGAPVAFGPFAPLKRARGTPDARCAHGLVCEWVREHTSFSHHESTGDIRRSARGGVTGLLRALPGDRSLVVTVVATEDVSASGWRRLSGAT